MACRGGGSGSFVSLHYVTVITLYVYVIFDVDLKAMFMLFYVYDVYLIMFKRWCESSTMCFCTTLILFCFISVIHVHFPIVLLIGCRCAINILEWNGMEMVATLPRHFVPVGDRARAGKNGFGGSDQIFLDEKWLLTE